MFRKVALIEISRNSLLIEVSSLQPTGCNATKNERLTKFFTDVLKILENVQGKLCNEVSLK